MTEREKKYLSDISNSIDLIKDFVSEIRSFSDYCNDSKTKSAVERHLAIIGEAVTRFIRESESNQLTNATQIISVRNKLIHAYDSIDDAIIWSVITLHLESLKQEVLEKLKEPLMDSSFRYPSSGC